MSTDRSYFLCLYSETKNAIRLFPLTFTRVKWILLMINNECSVNEKSKAISIKREYYTFVIQFRFLRYLFFHESGNVHWSSTVTFEYWLLSMCYAQKFKLNLIKLAFIDKKSKRQAWNRLFCFQISLPLFHSGLPENMYSAHHTCM